MDASIVLGVGFGDEGKGITTDYLCSQSTNLESTIVVRFSGGQQAGHTVIIDDVKHIHSTFPSGTLRGATGFISKYCTIDPNSLLLEYKELLRKGVTPNLFIDPKAMLTTPFDIESNRISEKTLNDGTCGRGVGKTMERNISSQYKLYAIDILIPDMLRSKLLSIAKNYYELNINDQFIIRCIDDYMHDIYKISGIPCINFLGEYILNSYESIIFEGSQGIMLDMDHGTIPNVTYANTTSINANKICKRLGLSSADISTYYVTRAYLSRHGNGWMPDYQGEELTLINNEEEINVHNKYQGAFRVQPLDIDLLNYAIMVDNQVSVSSKINLVITCTDQVDKVDLNIGNILVDIDNVIWSKSPDSKDFEVSLTLSSIN